MSFELELDNQGDGLCVKLTSEEDISQYATITGSRITGELIKNANCDYAVSNGCWGLALDAIASGKRGSVLLQGFVTNTSWSWTPGAILFLDSSSGGISQGDPSGGWTQEVGYAISATTIYFQPKESTCNL